MTALKTDRLITNRMFVVALPLRRNIDRVNNTVMRKQVLFSSQIYLIIIFEWSSKTWLDLCKFHRPSRPFDFGDRLANSGRRRRRQH